MRQITEAPFLKVHMALGYFDPEVPTPEPPFRPKHMLDRHIFNPYKS